MSKNHASVAKSNKQFITSAFEEGTTFIFSSIQVESDLASRLFPPYSSEFCQAHSYFYTHTYHMYRL